MKPFLHVFLLIASTGNIHQACAQKMDTVLDAFAEQLRFSDSGGFVRGSLTGTIDMEGHIYDGEPPGLLQTDEEWLFQPRATLFLDIQAGHQLYGFAQVRLDRGFDARDGPLELRLDEYALRFTPWKDGRLSFQAGQFATIVGRWVTRHLSWQNPFITAPLLYESPTRLSDLRATPSAYYLTYASGFPGYYYNPIIWGASYGSGFAASGKWSEFEWAVELKNSAPMSRPGLWPIDEKGFADPTISGRLAWRPDLRWTFGISATEGSYAGTNESFEDPNDFKQRLILVDLSYEYRHLQIWAEAAWSSFTTPRLQDDLKAFSWFLEARYKVTPRLSMALRWNDQRYSLIHYSGYSIGKWGEDIQRLDFAATWRFNAHMQIQAQVDHYWYETGDNDRFVLSARLTVRF